MRRLHCWATGEVFSSGLDGRMEMTASFHYTIITAETPLMTFDDIG